MLLEDGYECCGRTECLHEGRMMEMEQWFSGEKPYNPNPEINIFKILVVFAPPALYHAIIISFTK